MTDLYPAFWEVQKAIYDLLSKNTTFMTMIGNRLYDEPPANLIYPYVVFSSTFEIPENLHDKIGYEVFTTLTIYAQPEGLGYYQPMKIYDAINKLLNLKRLTLTSYGNVICVLEGSSANKDNKIRRIDLDYKCICYKK